MYGNSYAVHASAEMPTTRAARELPELPADVWQHIVVRLTLAHHIARTAPTCHVVSVAVRNAIKARRFSSEVVTLAGHTKEVYCGRRRPTAA